MNTQDFRMDWLDLLAVQGLSRDEVTECMILISEELYVVICGRHYGLVHSILSIILFSLPLLRKWEARISIDQHSLQ